MAVPWSRLGQFREQVHTLQARRNAFNGSWVRGNSISPRHYAEPPPLQSTSCRRWSPRTRGRSTTIKQHVKVHKSIDEAKASHDNVNTGAMDEIGIGRANDTQLSQQPKTIKNTTLCTSQIGFMHNSSHDFIGTRFRKTWMVSEKRVARSRKSILPHR